MDIALKALSLGVNDTSTAVNCIHYLSDITGEIARKEFPPQVRSQDGKPRLIVTIPTFEDYVKTAFDQIRISGKSNAAIFEQLAKAVAFVASCTERQSRREVLKQQLALIDEFAHNTLETEYEKNKLDQEIAKTGLTL